MMLTCEIDTGPLFGPILVEVDYRDCGRWFEIEAVTWHNTKETTVSLLPLVRSVTAINDQVIEQVYGERNARRNN